MVEPSRLSCSAIVSGLSQLVVVDELGDNATCKCGKSVCDVDQQTHEQSSEVLQVGRVHAAIMPDVPSLAVWGIQPITSIWVFWSW
jgi:hypothetical protein